MSMWSRRPVLRWLVPAGAAVLVIGGGAGAGVVAASADPELPPRGAAQLLVDLQTAQVDTFSGTVVQTAALGLPDLPDTGGQHSADLGSLWSGSNTLRVWYDGPERARLALLGTLGQSDIIRNGQDVWSWNSEENEATHLKLPEGFAEQPHRSPPPGSGAITPREAADQALAAIEPSTEVTTDGTAQVAGRDAYELVLTPRDGASLIDQVRLAVDAEQGLPLRVQVYGSAAEPAFEVRFTQISFDRPDPEQFRFNPPPGATVTEQDLLSALPFGENPLGMLGAGIRPRFEVVGDGWTSVLVARLPVDLGELDALSGLLESLPTVSGDWGSGRALASELFSVLLTDDGRVLVGAVTPQRLGEVAGDPAAALDDSLAD